MYEWRDGQKDLTTVTHDIIVIIENDTDYSVLWAKLCVIMPQ